MKICKSCGYEGEEETCPSCNSPLSDNILQCKLVKRNEEKRLVYGIVYEPWVVDAHGHWAQPHVIEEAAHTYLRNSSFVDIMHQEDHEDVYVVESYIAPVDFIFNEQPISKGAWVMTIKVNNPVVWEAIKVGKLNALSLHGYGFLETEEDSEV